MNGRATNDPAHDAAAQHDDIPAHSIPDILAATAVPGMGRIGVRRLLDRFGNVGYARRASDRELQQIGLKRDVIRALRNGVATFEPAEEIARAGELNVELLPAHDERYPRGLRGLHDAPPLLYVKGALKARDALSVALVGSRRASVYGRLMTERLAADLARAGFTVVSGFARGVDTVAHEAALKAGGRTIGVLGSGLANIYPRENADLADRLEEQGALISELPLGTTPSPANFPPRNRLIAALSLGVVVIEASKRSGALITARMAGELGRDVFAVPGDVNRPQTRGTHSLIKDGAGLVESVDDVIEALGPLPQPLRIAEDEPPVENPRALALNDRERKLYDLLDTRPREIDELARAAGLSAANVMSTLTVLEIKRLVVRHPGPAFARAGGFER